VGRAQAELIEDRGEGATGPEFFRSAPFHRAEGATHTLRVDSEGRTASMAVIVRDVPGEDRRDASSVYGYPGARVEGHGAPPAPEEVDWSATGLVSLFARERLGEPPFLSGARERGRVVIHRPDRPRAVRRRLAEQIRQGARRGYAVDVSTGPESADADRAAFHRAYTETMRAANAAERYFFDRAYVDTVLEFERSWLLVVRSGTGEPAAAAIAAASDGYLHYFLGGTVADARVDSPFKAVVARMLDLADDLDMPLNLGGGVALGDGLERFKRGFGNAEESFVTHEVVCDEVAYAELAGGRDAGGFFPAYRAP
jgi:hypothetical protein